MNEEEIDNAVKEIAEHQHQIVDDYCKAVLANQGGDETQIRENVGKMSCGDWKLFKKEKPIENKRCLVWIDNSCKGLKKLVAYPWSFYDTHVYTYKNGLWEGFSKTFQPPVVYWMQLPQPPKD